MNMYEDHICVSIWRSWSVKSPVSGLVSWAMLKWQFLVVSCLYIVISLQVFSTNPINFTGKETLKIYYTWKERSLFCKWNSTILLIKSAFSCEKRKKKPQNVIGANMWGEVCLGFPLRFKIWGRILRTDLEPYNRKLSTFGCVEYSISCV